ncbi:metal ABC transporter solute-binding protein, Zn/Mn family [Geomicrobium sp. JCM 19039]|uniref:metal ABC transporter solute-binding protein, Zn/Mn family n=1 Tax=Geomicrobium sp. JCM 19039 TaxID=1460636 RepID=UPI00045F48B1|nr:zinc ABC transporter substrate-binding protein [Geomicrobium sp. JCM 19039]GAK10828.1 zinc ABC transporter, periplasmic-binding protein ZnuA [Geomicrobium sp. JCM 19039]
MKKLLFLTIASSVILTACQDSGDESDEGTTDEDPLAVSTTLYALEDFTSRIGGEYVEVESIYPPNADAHTFEPSSSEFVMLAEQDLFIYSGVGMEPFADTAEEVLEDENVHVFAAGENLDLRGEGHHEHDHGHEEEGHDYSHDHAHEEDHDHAHDEQHADEDGPVIQGVQAHYHTGDTIDVHIDDADDAGDGEWHWYTRTAEAGDWQRTDVEGLEYSGEATETKQLKAVLYDEEDEVLLETNEVSVIIDDHDEEHGVGDPHVFLDPVLSQQIAENIKEVLIELRPEQEDDFTANYEALIDDLEQLDEALTSTFEEADHNQIIVSHAAYGYWEDRYGLEQLSVHGLSSTQEPSQSELVNIVTIAEENNLDYVIFENNVSSTITEVIQSEIGAESLVLRNMESISQEDSDNDEDYVSMMQMNIETLQQALND